MAAIEVPSRRNGSVGDTTHDLYRRYGKQIYAYCYHRLRSKEEAEDAVQTTFMNAFRSLQRGATAEHEQAWLYKIAQNVCIARHSSSSKRLRLETPNDFEVLQDVVPSREGDEPLELFGIEEALERMPENQRRAILLREWQGLSYREISEQLDLSQAAVEMLIFRARRTLAGALEQPGEEKKRRVGRKVGSLGSILGALKTLLGGGAAIKAAAVAAAAIAVVGEGASHTIVRRPTHVGSLHRTRAASQPVTAALSQSPSHAVDAGRNAGVVVAPATVRRAHTAVKKAQAAPHTSRPAVIAEPAAVAPPVVEAPPAPAPTVTTTASAPVLPPPAPAPTTPAPAQPAAPDAVANGKGKDKPKDPTPTPAPTQPIAPDPGANGNGNGKGKDRPKDPTPAPAPTPTPAPVQAPPTTTTTTTTTPITTTPAPVSVDPQPAHGNDGDHGHGKQKDSLPTLDQTQPVVPQAVVAVVTSNGDGNGNGKGLALGRAKQHP